ncbi:MAG TPA: MOSC N-terminal beta barrel domain-containing protein [Solirubrobacteraceae bacterium]
MSGPRLTVSALATTPVKGLRVASPARVQLDRGGVRGDRRLYLIDDDGRMVNGKHRGELMTISAELDDGAGHLTLTFADGQPLAGPIETGALVQTSFFSQSREARLVLGGFSAALSARAGQTLRLVEPADGVSAIDRGEHGTVSLIARPSIAALARATGVEEIDGRRFRMSIELDGGLPFEEDDWIGRELSVGEAVIVPRGHVGRCLVTSRHPETGEVDLATLDGLRALRGRAAATTEPLALGLHGEVVQPGAVCVGDPVQML